VHLNKQRFDRKHNLSDESGQSFIEFIFLLLVVMSLSFIMIRGFNGGMAKRWTALVTIISAPTSTEIEMR
tara:strand:+ start:88736 stop:88945 length:210 start_codon:yes stop_codon:yes gene_type:complete